MVSYVAISIIASLFIRGTNKKRNKKTYFKNQLNSKDKDIAYIINHHFRFGS
jgi:hypothetical protein